MDFEANMMNRVVALTTERARLVDQLSQLQALIPELTQRIRAIDRTITEFNNLLNEAKDEKTETSPPSTT